MMRAPASRWRGDRLHVRVHAQPNARRDEVLGLHGGAYRVRIAAPPRDGRANERLIAFLARTFGVPRSRVRIRAGTGARLKTVEIERPAALPGWLEDAGGATDGT
jgi:uncharacterized protein (TIGR00251 family)